MPEYKKNEILHVSEYSESTRDNRSILLYLIVSSPERTRIYSQKGKIYVLQVTIEI